MAGSTVTWKVTKQEQSQQFPTSGSPINGKDVTFEASNGYTGTIFIPDSVYQDPAKVKEMIAAELKPVIVNHQLTGSVTA